MLQHLTGTLRRRTPTLRPFLTFYSRPGRKALSKEQAATCKRQSYLFLTLVTLRIPTSLYCAPKAGNKNYWGYEKIKYNGRLPTALSLSYFWVSWTKDPAQNFISFRYWLFTSKQQLRQNYLGRYWYRIFYVKYISHRGTWKVWKAERQDELIHVPTWIAQQDVFGIAR